MRKVVYISGTRADFGLIKSTLLKANAMKDLEVSVLITGQHLSTKYGDTAEEVRASGLKIMAEVKVDFSETTGAAMARAISLELSGMVDAFLVERPDIVLLLGDRGEMLAGALAAIHLGIHIFHVHGGERSGTLDESLRHAISKLAHYHLVSMDSAKERLVLMGEPPEQIWVTGAPGLDGLEELAVIDREGLCCSSGFSSTRPIAMLLFHPVFQDRDVATQQIHQQMAGLLDLSLQILALAPNSDAGGLDICEALQQYKQHPDVHLITHAPRTEFLSWLASADVLVGNSSSGIIEAATLGIPVVNVGDRQSQRTQNRNLLESMPERADVARVTQTALQMGRAKYSNIYGDGKAGARIIKHLRTLPLSKLILKKSNAY